MSKNGNLKAAVNMNDTFAYACADAEDIEPWEVLLVSQAHRNFGSKGVTEWASRKRGCKPIKPRETGITDKDWLKFLQRLDDLCASIEKMFPWWHDDA